MSWARSLLCLLLFVGGILSAASLQAEEVTVSRAGHRVLHEAWLADDAQRAADLLGDIAREVADRTGLEAGLKPAEIVIAGDLESARRASGAAIPEWAAGAHIPTRGRIVLRMDSIRNSAPAKSLETVLRHEWVHFVLNRARGNRPRLLPLWMEEGLAEVLGGGISVDAGAALDSAAAFGHLIPLDQIATAWPRSAERAGLAYRQGASWVRLYVEQFGWERLQGLIAALRDDPRDLGEFRFDQLFLEITGENTSQFEGRWKVSLKEKATPWFHLFGRDLGTTIMLALAVLSILVFAYVRRRRRRAIEALPDEPSWEEFQ